MGQSRSVFPHAFGLARIHENGPLHQPSANQHKCPAPVAKKSFPARQVLYLQSVLEQLVHPGHLGGDGEVDGAVANLDDESTADVGVDLGNDLELLALLDVLRLADGGFETAEGAVVEGLWVIRQRGVLVLGVM